MKNNLPLWIIGVSLSIILILMPLQDAYAGTQVAFQVDGSKTTATDAIQACFDVNDVDNIGDLTTATNWRIDGNALTGGDVTFVSNACGTNNNDGVTITGMTAAGGLPIAADGTPTIELIDIDLEHATNQFAQTVPINTALTDGIVPTVSSAATTTATTIVLIMTEAMTVNVNDPGDFTIGGVATNPTVTVLGVAGISITLTLSAPIVSTDTPTVDYNGEPGDLEDVPGNDLADFNNQAVTNTITGTGGSDDIPPSFVTSFDENEYPISIGDTKFTFAELGFNNPTTTVEIGKPIRVNLLMYDDFGPTYITQVEFYTNTRGVFSGVSDSDTSIIYKKDSPRIVLDPNGFFSDVILTSSIVNQKLQLTFDITFAKEMEKSDIIVQARDIGNNVGTLTVSDAWQVIPAQAEGTAETPTDESADDSIPGEIKVKTLNVEKPAYFMREEILFFGTVDGHKLGSVVSIIIRNPSYGFLTLISTVPDKDGYFEAKIKTDSKFKTDGTYTATAFADNPNKGMQAIFYFSNRAPPPPPVTTSPGESIQSEPTTTSEPVTPKPKTRLSFVDPQKDPQSYVDRYNTEPTYKNWFDGNFPDYTIYEAVGLPEPAKEKVPVWIKNNAKWWSEGQIDDGTFVSGIQFLMTKKIIDIPDLPEQASEKARPSFVDPQKDPQSYVDRYNNEASYKEWFDENYPDYTIEEAVGIPEPIPGWIKNNAEW